MMERRSLIDPKLKPGVRRQSELLEVNRSSFYYRPKGESEENRALMRSMDQLFLEDPTLRVLGMQDALKDQDLHYNVKRIRRLLRLMGIEPIYPRKSLSRLGKAKYIRPCLPGDFEGFP